MADEPSAELLDRFRDNQSGAAEELFVRHFERLTRLAQTRISMRLQQRFDPEDVVLSAYRSFFVAARRGRFVLTERGDLWRLLVRITLNKLHRRIAHHRSGKRSIDTEGGSPSWVDAVSAAGPEEAVALAEELDDILRALDPRTRRVVELRLQGESVAAIAAEMQCAERTVRRHLEGCRELLVTRLTATGETDVDDNPSGVDVTDELESVAPIAEAGRAARIAAGLPESRFEDLVLKQMIGAGGFGKVYLAVQKKTGSRSAVKFLRKQFRSDTRAVERLLAEAATVARFDHPGIVTLQGVGRTPAGGWFLEMEYAEGGSLHEQCERGDVMTDDALCWVRAAAEALHHVHEQGIVHCDLKPANLLLTQRGQIKLTDFGFARRVDDASASWRALAGTVPFMAPEQVDPCWGEVDRRTDVYGLGAVLLTLLTGTPPYSGGRPLDVLTQIVTDGDPPGLASLSPSLRDLCRKCLAQQADERFPTTAALAEAITLVNA